MRKRTVRIAWLVAAGVALGLLAIGATSYVMRLDQESEDQQPGAIGGPLELVDHSSVVDLMDREGRHLAHFGHAATPAQLIETGQALGQSPAVSRRPRSALVAVGDDDWRRWLSG